MKIILIILAILFIISLIEDAIYTKKEIQYWKNRKNFDDFLMKNNAQKRFKNENDINYRLRIIKKIQILKKN